MDRTSLMTEILLPSFISGRSKSAPLKRRAREEMTRRPAQHRIASLAVAAVRREWNLQGHAVDEIHEDYGEDLLVQICHEGRLDPARVWVQVKGTERDCSGRNLPSVKVKADQVLRWVRTADLVIVVLWDVKHERGWFTMPQEQFDHVELSNRSNRAISITFSRGLAFDQAAVAKLCWAARIEHANRAMVYARSNLAEAREMELEASVQFYKGVLSSLIFDFGVAIKAVRPMGGFTEHFAEVLFAYYIREGPKDVEEATTRAMMTAVFETIHLNCSENGAPLALVKELCATFYPLFFTPDMLAKLVAARINFLSKQKRSAQGDKAKMEDDQQ
ncbi:DUF4365 domain-containing protein [Streptomyces sp. NPDC019531]|uniref:DUF4365 domain-containing protein n=1 Tax=Streptomyces sp. NPDC019531 TaxID=3365062 RepID=UPI00384C4BAA